LIRVSSTWDFAIYFVAFLAAGGSADSERNVAEDKTLPTTLKYPLKRQLGEQKKKLKSREQNNVESVAVQGQTQAHQPKSAQGAEVQEKSRTCARQVLPHTYRLRLAQHAKEKAKLSILHASIAVAQDWLGNVAKSPLKFPWE
jgi:hypothetical protein